MIKIHVVLENKNLLISNGDILISTTSVTNGPLATTEDITVTSNSTQTPCDLSPLPINDEMLPQAHHQNPGHCIASFAAINQMRQNAQVRKKINSFVLFITVLNEWNS